MENLASRLGMIVVATAFAACDPLAEASSIDQTPQAQSQIVGLWAGGPSECEPGFDSLLLKSDGSASGWESVGTWEQAGPHQVSIHFTSSGMGEDSRAEGEHLGGVLGQNGATLTIGDVRLVRCAPEDHIGNGFDTAVESVGYDKASEAALYDVRQVSFGNLSPHQSREVLSGLGECAVDVTADMKMDRLDLNRDGQPDWLIVVGRTTMSPCAGNARYSKLLVSQPDGSYEGILLNYATAIDARTIQSQSFIDGCDDPHSQRRLVWSQSGLTPVSGCISPQQE